MLDLTNCRFLAQEFFNDISGGERNVVDLVAEVMLRDEPGVVLIHIEHQGYVQEGFNERMFRYFSRLYEKHRVRILPVAIFAYDQVRDEPNRFEMGFTFLEVLRFQFHKVELRRLSWREYIRQDNPVAAALLSKMGFRPEERVAVRREFLRMLLRMQLDEARTRLLVVFFETYLQLTPQEEEALQQEWTALGEEGVKMQEYMTSWENKGRIEGRMEGRMQGRIEGRMQGRIEGRMETMREAITQFLVTRFDFDSRKVQEQISGLQDLEALNRLLLQLYAAPSSAQAQSLLREATNPPVS